MESKNSQSIQTQLQFAFSIPIIIMIALGVTMFFVVNSIEKNLSESSVSHSQLTRAQKIVWLDEVLTQSMRNYVLTEDEKWKQRYLEHADQLDNVINTVIENATTQETRDIFERQDKANEELVAMENKAMRLVANGNAYEALELIESSDYRRWKDKYSQTIDEFLNNSQSGVEATQQRLENSVEETSNTSVGFLIGSIIVGILTFIYATFYSRSIARPIKRISTIAQDISNGNLDQTISVKQKNEIGLLASALKNMTSRLQEIVSGIKTGANNIASASQQVSSSSQQISQGSSQQASAAEEVSSSMEEMTSNIQQNSDNAKETEQIAQKSTEGIKEGNQAAQTSVKSMKEIAEKISIINDIAYQTNILALNAAVEAARAGEHGRGFSVVAAEIRKLAERSSEAAKDIDEKSKAGVEVSEKAGEKLNSIVPEIEKTTRLVQEITASTSEMNNGASQVNSSVQQLNQVTQQNASSSEELATNAEELSGQAEQLKQLVGFFKLGEEEGSQFSQQTQNYNMKQQGNQQVYTPQKQPGSENVQQKHPAPKAKNNHEADLNIQNKNNESDGNYEKY